MARELLPGLQVRTVSVPVRCVPPSYNAHSCVRPALKQSAALGEMPGRGARAAARTSRAVVCGAWTGAGGLARLAGLGTPHEFLGCQTVVLAIGLHRAAFPTLAVLPPSDHRSWSHVARRQPRRWSYVASVHRQQCSTARAARCPSASRRRSCPSAARRKQRKRRRRHQSQMGRPGSRVGWPSKCSAREA